MIDFYDLFTAKGRLEASVIQVNGEPFYIEEVEEGAGHNKWYFSGFFCKYYSDGIKRNKFDLEDERVDLKPIPLGFVNREKTIARIHREPKRMWKVGLCPANAAMAVTNYDGFLQVRKDFMPLILSEAFRSSVMGVFPPLNKILASKAEVLKKAFSRNWGVIRRPGDEKLLLIHKYHFKVGVVEDGEPILDREFEFLMESLAEDMLK